AGKLELGIAQEHVAQQLVRREFRLRLGRGGADPHDDATQQLELGLPLTPRPRLSRTWILPPPRRRRRAREEEHDQRASARQLGQAHRRVRRERQGHRRRRDPYQAALELVQVACVEPREALRDYRRGISRRGIRLPKAHPILAIRYLRNSGSRSSSPTASSVLI